jgi:ubiquinone/menaquinone biosynthesis C-methylase UbiE
VREANQRREAERGALMGFYSRVVFPRLCDWTLNNRIVAQHRRELLAAAGGEILEIGFGSGLNLAQYPGHVRKITTIDPNVGMNRRAQKRIAEAGIQVDQRLLSGENLPFAEHSFDTVVSTFTLCSIPDVGRALAQVFRVLKPGGRFLFLEHGLSVDAAVQKWQHRLNGLQMWLGDGCHLDRNMRELVSAQPFANLAVDEFYAEKTPKTHGYLYRGNANKAA